MWLDVTALLVAPPLTIGIVCVLVMEVVVVVIFAIAGIIAIKLFDFLGSLQSAQMNSFLSICFVQFSLVQFSSAQLSLALFCLVLFCFALFCFCQT